MAGRVAGNFSMRCIIAMRPASERQAMAAPTATMAQMSVMPRATQPMATDTPTAPEEPSVSEPAMETYTSSNTGRIMMTVKAKMMLMMHRSAAG